LNFVKDLGGPSDKDYQLRKQRCQFRRPYDGVVGKNQKKKRGGGLGVEVKGCQNYPSWREPGETSVHMDCDRKVGTPRNPWGIEERGERKTKVRCVLSFGKKKKKLDFGQISRVKLL